MSLPFIDVLLVSKKLLTLSRKSSESINSSASIDGVCNNYLFVSFGLEYSLAALMVSDVFDDCGGFCC